MKYKFYTFILLKMTSELIAFLFTNLLKTIFPRLMAQLSFSLAKLSVINLYVLKNRRLKWKCWYRNLK